MAAIKNCDSLHDNVGVFFDIHRLIANDEVLASEILDEPGLKLRKGCLELDHLLIVLES